MHRMSRMPRAPIRVITRDLSFDTSSHSADAIQRAAYRFSDRLSCELVVQNETCRCTVFVETDDTEIAETVVSDFRKEVLDQVLRERIRRETEDVRNVILAHAFSNTGLALDE